MTRTVVDAVDLERRLKDMYTQVALDPHGQFHFEMGRAMARRHASCLAQALLRVRRRAARAAS